MSRKWSCRTAGSPGHPWAATTILSPGTLMWQALPEEKMLPGLFPTRLPSHAKLRLLMEIHSGPWHYWRQPTHGQSLGTAYACTRLGLVSGAYDAREPASSTNFLHQTYSLLGHRLPLVALALTGSGKHAERQYYYTRGTLGLNWPSTSSSPGGCRRDMFIPGQAATQRRLSVGPSRA